MTTDIVVATHNRLNLLKQTLAHIWERTSTPYRLHIIDDASTEGNAVYVRTLAREGRIYNAVLRPERRGITQNLRSALNITLSDPLVITDDDILCPQIDPDWLARGLSAMERYPRLGVLALNNPQANVGYNKRAAKHKGGDVTYCRNVGGTFAFVRREALADCVPAGNPKSPFHRLCIAVAKHGWRVGYLTDVYCQHLGAVSVRSGKRLGKELAQVEPVDDVTLAPPKGYRK